MQKDNGRNSLIILVILLIAGLAQTSLMQIAPGWLSKWVGSIDWLLLVTVYIGLQREPLRAMITGAVAGLINDALSGGVGMGVSGISYVLAAYVTWSITSLIIVDSLVVRFVTVATSSLVNTSVRLIFYALLGISLPVFESGRMIAADYVFTLLVHLIASTILYIILDRIFLRGDVIRRRRSDARRKRI